MTSDFDDHRRREPLNFPLRPAKFFSERYPRLLLVLTGKGRRQEQKRSDFTWQNGRT